MNDNKTNGENSLGKEEDLTSHSPLIPHSLESDSKKDMGEASGSLPLPPQVQAVLQKPLVDEKPVSPALTPTPQHVIKDNKNLSLPLLIVFLILSFLCGLLMALFFFQNQLQRLQNKQNTPAFINDKQKLVIGTDATYPPMEYLNKDGKLIGLDIDLSNKLAETMGTKAEIKSITWNTIFDQLEKKNIDMIISSVSITDERKQKYLFSDPYLDTGQVIVSNKEKPITDVNKLKGKTIAVQKGTTNEQLAAKYTARELIKLYDDYEQTAKAVSMGSAEATLADITFANTVFDTYNNIKITSDPITTEYYGIVMRKDDTQLKKQVDAALTILKVNGYLMDLRQKWID